ncbi:MAG: hypothetical protein LBK58_16205 [Prevotellaceae bacterium]|nr:hypothetical protein [Prevotellaceae bacterium]
MKQIIDATKNPVSPPLKGLMQKAYNIAGIKNPVRDEILVEINSLSSKIPSGMTCGISVFTCHPFHITPFQLINIKPIEYLPNFHIF